MITGLDFLNSLIYKNKRNLSNLDYSFIKDINNEYMMKYLESLELINLNNVEFVEESYLDKKPIAIFSLIKFNDGYAIKINNYMENYMGIQQHFITYINLSDPNLEQCYLVIKLRIYLENKRPTKENQLSLLRIPKHLIDYI